MRESNPKTRSSNTSRYKLGVVNYYHKGKVITSTVGDENFDSYIKKVDQGEYRLGAIPPGYELRPDLISNLFLGKTDLMWKLMIINNIPDPFEGFKVGQQLLLPK